MHVDLGPVLGLFLAEIVGHRGIPPGINPLPTGRFAGRVDTNLAIVAIFHNDRLASTHQLSNFCMHAGMARLTGVNNPLYESLLISRSAARR